MKVAILGTGRMGAATARRLHQQGFELRLWNRTRQRAEQLGFGEVFDTPADAASGADVVISMLTDPPAVRQAYLEPDGALEATGARVYIDSSTVDPKTHEELARATAQHGSTFVEAPVLGSIPAVEAGKARRHGWWRAGRLRASPSGAAGIGRGSLRRPTRCGRPAQAGGQ